MVQKHVLSVTFLALVSANVIQAGLIPELIRHHEHLPHFISLLNIPSVTDYAANAASKALGDFKSYFNNFRSGLSDLNIPPQFRLLHRFANGGLLPSLTSPAIINGAADTAVDAVASRILPSAADHLIRPGLLGGFFGRHLLGNGGGNLGGGAASAGASAAA